METPSEIASSPFTINSPPSPLGASSALISDSTPSLTPEFVFKSFQSGRIDFCP
jgi:hypothetical protein